MNYKIIVFKQIYARRLTRGAFHFVEGEDRLVAYAYEGSAIPRAGDCIVDTSSDDLPYLVEEVTKTYVTGNATGIVAVLVKPDLTYGQFVKAVSSEEMDAVVQKYLDAGWHTGNRYYPEFNMPEIINRTPWKEL